MLRTYGRYQPTMNNPLKTRVWIEVDTDANGFDDSVWLTTMCQCLKLNLGESPFFSDYGIPAHQSVVTQVQPDYYTARTQRRFAARFASLIVSKVPATPVNGMFTPTYNVRAVSHYGAILSPAAT